MKNIILPEDIRDEILFPLGYPFLDDSDFEELLPGYTKSIDVIQRFANKAIRQYNVVNPPLLKKTYTQVAHEFEYAYPEDVYGMLNVRMITVKGRGVLGPNAVTNTFANLNTMTNGGMMGGSGGNAFGTKYNFGMDTTTFLYNKARMQGVRDTTKNLVLYNDPQTKSLAGYLNMKADLRVTWLLTITAWEQIPFSQRELIIQMASAHLLKWLGGLIEREQIGDLAVDLDGKAYIDQGKEMEDEVKEIWNSYRSITKV